MPGILFTCCCYFFYLNNNLPLGTNKPYLSFMCKLMHSSITERINCESTSRVPSPGQQPQLTPKELHVSWQVSLKLWHASCVSGLRARCRSPSCRTWWTGARWHAAEGGSSVPSSSTTARYTTLNEQDLWLSQTLYLTWLIGQADVLFFTQLPKLISEKTFSVQTC